MIEPRRSPLELMRLHVEALYTHDARSRIESVNQWDGGVPARFHLGRTRVGHLWRFRTDLPDSLVAELEELCHDEPAEGDPAETPVHHQAYTRLLGLHMPTTRIWTGPAYGFPANVAPGAPPVEIDADNADLLRGELEPWLADVPHRRPFLAMVEDGRAVSVCASVRITGAAHEAGVETLPAYRRRGHAANVVAGWAQAVAETGAIPLYSTSWDNAPSRGVAASLGLSTFGVDFHIT